MDGTSEIELRLVPDAPGVEVREDENGRTYIRGYAALYNSDSKDLGGFIERLLPGAFDDVLDREYDVYGKYNHDRLLGRSISGTLKLFKDERGLAYRIVPKKADADVVESIQRGDVRGSSFAFRVAPDGESWYYDNDGVLRRDIKKIGYLHDVGPVDNPAYAQTESYVSHRTLEKAREEAAKHAARLAPPPKEEVRDVKVEAPPSEPAKIADKEPDYRGLAAKLDAAVLDSLQD